MKKPMTYFEALEIMQGNLEQLQKLGIMNDKAMLSIQKAIEALEKQVPKMVIIDLNGFVRCPCCEQHIRYKAYKSRFCFHCGQAIEWTN